MSKLSTVGLSMTRRVRYWWKGVTSLLFWEFFHARWKMLSLHGGGMWGGGFNPCEARLKQTLGVPPSQPDWEQLDEGGGVRWGGQNGGKGVGPDRNRSQMGGAQSGGVRWEWGTMRGQGQMGVGARWGWGWEPLSGTPSPYPVPHSLYLPPHPPICQPIPDRG